MPGIRLFAGCLAATAAWAQAVDFQRDIQPIFKASCVACHSGAQAAAGLRLDSRADAMRVISAGHGRDSRLVKRILGEGNEKRMPLAGKPLAESQIAAIERWIDAGAPWPDASAPAAPRSRHWAYNKPERPPVPAVRNAAWVRNPIDAFILARLEKEGLQPSREASRETLIRRVALDLTGLPPTIPEIDAFLADRSPDAYEKLVDRLLASPHYGERQARPWLDLARYADTNGYEKDDRRSIWKYRDWVIDAFNRDMPYDEFTIEQIAGDMLPNPTTSQLIATGFHRNTMFNEEGGVDKEEAHWENLVDRVGTTATVWLGTTLACAQCHNHKFDPFTQKEYYQFMAFFANTDRGVREYGDTSTKYIEPILDLPTAEQESRRAVIKAEIAKLETLLKSNTAALAAEQAKWEAGIRAASADWTVLDPSALHSSAGTTLAKQSGGVILAGGTNPAADEYDIEARLPAAGITGIRIEALPHASLPRGGPGRDPYGNFFLEDFRAEVVHNGQAVPVAVGKPVVDEGRLRDKKFLQLWSVDATRDDKRLPRQIVFPAEAAGSAGDILRLRIIQKSEFGGQGLGCFRVSVTTSADPARIVKVLPKLRPLLDASPGARSAEQRRDLETFFRGIAPSLDPARARLKDLRKQLDDLAIVNTLIMGEAKNYERPSTFIRARGVFTSPGEKVYAATPSVLPPLAEGDMPNRLGLAHWLVSPENPLTARVAVNRMWEAFFGRGIVETSEDFGSQGERPTHPELLDWLATEFIARKWSMKQMDRLIVTSAAYRQSSASTPALVERDPYNRLLARGPRFRMEAEMIRDVALAASGLLSPKIGGPSVFPYQPPGIWDMPYNDDKWVESKGEDRYRRGIYTFARRTAPYPSMLTFDAPSREFCTVRRVRTDTPLQALTALNDPAFFEAAGALAGRILEHGGTTDRERAVYGFRLCVARAPEAQELDRSLGALAKERTWFGAHAADAAKLGGPEKAAWTMLSNVLLNLDETLTKE